MKLFPYDEKEKEENLNDSMMIEKKTRRGVNAM